MILLFAVFFLPGVFSLGLEPASPETLFSASYHMPLILISVAHVLLLLYIIDIQSDIERTVFGWVPFKLQELGPAAGITLLLMLVLGAISFLSIVSWLTPFLGPFENAVPAGGGLRYRDAWWTVPLVLAGSVATGYREESFYRGYLIPRLQQAGSSRVTAVVISTLLFATGHSYQGVLGVVFAGAAGLLLGAVFLLRPHIHALAIGHGLYNAFVIVFLSGSGSG